MAVRLDPYKKLNTKLVRRVPGIRTAVYGHAQEIGTKAEARLAAHRRPFDATTSSVTVTRGTVDSFINLEDTGEGAIGIEFGYRAENGRIVHGLHIITGAAGLA